jgi:hypothetical protein
VKRLRSMSAVVALAVLTLPAVAPAAPTPFGSLTSVLAQGRLSQLRGVQEIKSWFNAYKGRPRLILLLSPT